MSRAVVATCGLVMAALMSLASVVNAQHDHQHGQGSAEIAGDVARDERVTLNLGPTAEAGLKLTMREHLEAIHDVVAALGRAEFDRAASIAHEELGFPKHHRAMEREAGATFPPEYHDLAMAHHREAEDLAAVIPSHDFKAIISQLDKTIGACVSCHRAFKL
ncbi:hypothetical protein YTPLAS18_36610 [Nitrospira sp.]|nr:hypothetical protein YTPLAS18_36610 [Nitrospira sp.]